MTDSLLVLGLDTSGTRCSVALWRNEQVLYQQIVQAPNLHSTLLADLVGGGLRELQLPPAAVQLVCVTSGPGSFTGLRIGMAYAKGFCYALQRPLIAVTNFEVLARQVQKNNLPVFVLIDARRESYYLGIFKNNAQLLDEYKVVKVSELDRQLETAAVVICARREEGPDYQLPEAVKGRVVYSVVEPEQICRTGYAKFQSGERIDPELLEPLYIQPFAGVL
jgi:tRNA threonylcarbamoyladenosine biosynthesis protein TsaB